MPTGSIGPQTITITTSENVGSDTFYVSWTFDGYSWNINYWCIDDVKISSTNQPPTVNAGEDQTLECGNDVTLIGDVYDPDGDFLTYEWKEGGTVYDSSNLPATDPPIHHYPFFTHDFAPGEHIITLTVSDTVTTISDDVHIFVLEDTAPPVITAEFIPIDVETDEGKFEISFSAVDNCDPDPEVTAVILLPDLDDPYIAYTVREFKLEFTLDDNKLEVKDPVDPTELWNDIQDDGGLQVDSGQMVYIELPEGDPTDWEIYYDAYNVLRILGYKPTLRVIATDDSGNTAVLDVQPVFEE